MLHVMALTGLPHGILGISLDKAGVSSGIPPLLFSARAKYFPL